MYTILNKTALLNILCIAINKRFVKMKTTGCFLPEVLNRQVILTLVNDKTLGYNCHLPCSN